MMALYSVSETFHCTCMSQVIHDGLLEIPFTQDGSGYFIKATDGLLLVVGRLGALYPDVLTVFN